MKHEAQVFEIAAQSCIINQVQNGVPKSTHYKNQWAYGIFEGWQRQRLLKVPIVDVLGLLKNNDYHHVGVMSLIFKLE